MSHAISEEEFYDLASSWGISRAGAAGVLPAIAHLAPVIAAMDDLRADPPSVAQADRVVHTDARQDPYNAVVHWVSVRKPGARGLLSGVGVAVKDCVAVAGVPMTAGSALLQGFVPDRDSTVVRRLLDAGGHICATTNMDEMGVAPSGDSSCYGPTLNPWDTTRTAGGSSGGSAAALYYDGIDVALGADSGGSVRIPAAWCGLVGLKPTHGLVPHSGVLGGEPLLDHVGPLARTTADVAAVLQVLAGTDDEDPDPRQPARLPRLDAVAAVESAPASLAGLRIGVLAEGLDPAGGVSPEVRQAFDVSLARLRELGASVVPVSVPEHRLCGPIAFNLFPESFAAQMRGGGALFGAGGRYWPELAEALRRGFEKVGDALSPTLKLMLILGSGAERAGGGSRYARAANLRHLVTTGYEKALAECDVLAMPTVPVVAHPVAPGLDPADRALRAWGLVANTAPTNITGHPAITLPLGLAEGLPAGVMLVGRKFADTRLLTVGETVERAIGWPRRPPENRGGTS
ncbi:amidase [Amycolatopsis sacchari]|uniref:Amidase n=1 Tax=Amycolatopsis sacchari TaxID=115433 RepID=A0A1I3VNY0_9PSEU|nr:amidase family protein [Amycolatopsis sacchari]SFJ96882.1 amidase [Amycolatopsis sacchari]